MDFQALLCRNSKKGHLQLAVHGVYHMDVTTLEFMTSSIKKKSSCFSQDYLKCDCIQMSRYKQCITCASSLCSVFHFNSHTEKAALCSQDLIHREMKQERILSEKPYFMTTGYMACNLQKGFQEYMPLQILVCNRLLQMVYIDSREFIFNFFINPNTWENPYL